jgi:uncharacterized protein
MIQATLPPQLVHGPKRYALLICGWTNVALGMIGALVPGMPTTVFLLIALWAFTRSSPRCRAWLYNHPKWGPPLAAWSQHGVIPPRAKCLALTSMMISFALITALAAPNWATSLSIGAILSLVAAFIVTRPSHPPAAARAPEHARHPPLPTLTDEAHRLS